MMNGFRLSRALVVACALLAVAGLAAFGCAKKITRVDASYTSPEGQFSPSARLILYPDIEVSLLEYLDKAPVGPDVGDSLLRAVPVRLLAPGVLYGLVIDGTPATGYQMLRREAGGGYLPLKDFVIHPTVRWLETHWEGYQFLDLAPGGYDPPTFLGRGLVSGVVSGTSPLTNAAQIPGGPSTPMSFTVTSFPTQSDPRIKIRVNGTAITPIRYSGPSVPPDSLFTISWGAVPGAAGYWVQVFQYHGAPSDEIIANGLPSPLATGNLVDLKVAYVAAPDTLYKIGTTPVELFADKTLLTSGAYDVRIAAVDANGRMTGYSFGNADVALTDSSYIVYPLGAFIVSPKRPDSGPLRAAGAAWGGAPPGALSRRWTGLLHH